MNMTRTLTGGIAAGIILFLIGYLFWGTPLSEIAYGKVSDAQNASVQAALAQQLALNGTGTYQIPDPGSPEGTTLYGQGPVALVHFNTGGFAVMDGARLAVGFVLALVTGLLMSFGLAATSGGAARPFGDQARLVVCLALAFTLWAHLAQPVFQNFGWVYWVYSFVAYAVGFSLAGLAIARWFLPRATSESAPPR